MFLSFPFKKSRNVLNEPMFTTNSCKILQKSNILSHKLFFFGLLNRKNPGDSSRHYLLRNFSSEIMTNKHEITAENS